MGRRNPAQIPTLRQVRLGGRDVEYRLIPSKAARTLRIRVGPNGVEVVQPSTRKVEEVAEFLANSEAWLLDQLARVARFSKLRRPERQSPGETLLRGEPTPVRLEVCRSRIRGNRVRYVDGEIVVSTGPSSLTPVSRSLELWMRREARRDVQRQVAIVAQRIGQQPRKLYLMDQRTKWGNCSARRNLSFNWRLIHAPEYVLRYLVTHETVHLAIPDHSAKFWLTVQSHCPESEKAKQWLARHHARLAVGTTTCG